MNTLFKQIWVYLDTLGANAGKHRIGLASAGITFYVLFAIVPTVIALSLLASAFLPVTSVTEAATNVTSTLGVATIQNNSLLPLVNLASSTANLNVFTLSSLLAILIASFSASRIVMTLRTTFDDIFGVTDLRHSLVQRLAAAIIAMTAFLVAVCVAAVFLLVPKISAHVVGTAIRFDDTVFNIIATFFLTLFTIFGLYRYAPHYSQKFLSRNVAPISRPRIGILNVGVWFTALWVLGSTFFLQYFIELSTGSTSTIMIFGSSASIMIWMYLVWFGIFLGAEIASLHLKTPKKTRESIQ